MNRSIRIIVCMLVIMLSWSILPAKDTFLMAGNTAGTAVEKEAAETDTEGQAAPPDIMIPDPLFTFDTVVDGTEVVHDFRVYNRGKGALAITKVQTG